MVINSQPILFSLLPFDLIRLKKTVDCWLQFGLIRLKKIGWLLITIWSDQTKKELLTVDYDLVLSDWKIRWLLITIWSDKTEKMVDCWLRFGLMRLKRLVNCWLRFGLIGQKKEEICWLLITIWSDQTKKDWLTVDYHLVWSH